MNQAQQRTMHTIIVSTVCNEMCTFCNTDEHAEHYYPTPESVYAKIDAVAKEDHQGIQFTGGEPTIHPEFWNYLGYANKKNVFLSMQSNGVTAADISVAKRLASYGLKYAFIPLHSPNRSNHDRITQLQGSFDKTVQGIQNLLKQGIAIDISFVCNLLNYHETEAFIDFCSKNLKGIGRVCLSFVSPNVRAWDNRWIIPRMSDAAPYMKKAIDTGENVGIKIDIPDNCGIPLCFLKGYESYSSVYRTKETPSLRVDRTKPQQCSSGIWGVRCTGVWKRYIELYGDSEIIPVK
jgi:sulfatase maturation enzyme AslB (radical SAM superfamily)